MIKEFFGKHGRSDFLNKIICASDVSEQDRKMFVRFLADYVISLFGMQPTTDDMLKFANAAVDLVPALVSAVCIYS